MAFASYTPTQIGTRWLRYVLNVNDAENLEGFINLSTGEGVEIDDPA